MLIPARNEAAAIGLCLDHVLAQDVPRDRLEVVVVDGDSDDGTGQIAEAILAEAGLARWSVHRNAGGSTPSNLNAGLALVRAPVVCRVDARSLVPPDYVRRCEEVLEQRADVAVVGGCPGRGAPLRVQPGPGNRPRPEQQVRHGPLPLPAGRAQRASPTRCTSARSVRAELRRSGGWDERFGTNQDFDLNRRMAQYGIVWFEAGLAVGYFPRASVGDLFRQYRRFGRWKARYWRITGDRPQPRQAVLLVAPGLAALVTAIGLWRRPRATIAAIFGGAMAVEAVGSRSVRPAAPGGPCGRCGRSRGRRLWLVVRSG